MKHKLLTVAKWSLYPLFYCFCLFAFGLLTFPYGRLRDRIVSEFNASQKPKPGEAPKRLEIDELDGYWFTGVEARGVRIIVPPDATTVLKAGGKPVPDSVIAIDEAHGRIRILPLLLGKVRLAFWASAFGGEISGILPLSSRGDLEVDVENVELGRVSILADQIGMPLSGSASGAVRLSQKDGKFSKADGSFDLTIDDVVVGDGKTLVKGLFQLPKVRVGSLKLTGEAKAGALTVGEFGAKGKDIEISGEGKVTLRDPFGASRADLVLRFKFTDSFRTASAVNKVLLGDPASTRPGDIENFEPKIKKAKRADGFYGFHVKGKMTALRFDPWAGDGVPTRATSTSTSTKGGSKALPNRKPFATGTPRPTLTGGTGVLTPPMQPPAPALTPEPEPVQPEPTEQRAEPQEETPSERRARRREEARAAEPVPDAIVPQGSSTTEERDLPQPADDPSPP